jgi:hypothetical protein
MLVLSLSSFFAGDITPTASLAATPATAHVTKTSSNHTYYLPYVTDQSTFAGIDYTGNVQVMNAGSAAANFSISYYTQNGTLISTDTDNNTPLQPNTSYFSTPPAGIFAFAVVTSDQPLTVIVNESGIEPVTPGHVLGGAAVTNYAGIDASTDIGTDLDAPAAQHNAYGGNYRSSYIIENVGTVATQVQIQYYYHCGYSSTGQEKDITTQQTVTVAANTVMVADDGMPVSDTDLTCNGGAHFHSINGQPLAVVFRDDNTETPSPLSSDRPALLFLASVPKASQTIYVPAFFSWAYGNFMTGIAMNNTSDITATVTMKVTDQNGNNVDTPYNKMYIGPHQNASFFGLFGPDGKTYIKDFRGSVMVTSDQPLAAFIVEYGTIDANIVTSSFVTLPNGSNRLGLPQLYKLYTGGAGYGIGINSEKNPASGSGNLKPISSGFQIANLSQVPTSITITYYNADGSVQYVGHLGTLKPGATVGLYQGFDPKLPKGFAGSAIVTADNPNAALSAMVNVSDGQSMNTYTIAK